MQTGFGWPLRNRFELGSRRDLTKRATARWLALAEVMLLGWLISGAATSANAVTVDNGWTQIYNPQYDPMAGQVGVGVNCYPYCGLWPLGATEQIDSDPNLDIWLNNHGMGNEIDYAIARWQSQSTHSIYTPYPLRAESNRNAPIKYLISHVGRTGYCGGTQIISYTNAPPGSRNQITFSFTDIFTNLDQTFEIGGAPNPCDMGITLTHELGHALGLGHTHNQGQLMYGYQYNGAAYYPHLRDICGYNYIYDQSYVC